MQKILLTLFLFSISISSTLAHTIGVGYVNKQVGTSTFLKATGKNNASAAIKVSNNDLSPYRGNTIKTVRISLPNTKLFVDSIVVWVRQSLNGKNLAMGKITRFKDDAYGNIQEGWNEVALETPYSLSKDQDLYVGYTYYQRTTICATRATDDVNQGVSFIQLGANTEWCEYSTGTFAIEAGIDGPTMPENDFWLMSSKGIILGNNTQQVEVRLYNRGQQPASLLTVECQGAGIDYTTQLSTNIQSDQMDTLTFVLPEVDFLCPGDSVKICITKINDQEDVNMANNTANSVFNYLRILLLEEFTTERCPNCPKAAGYLHDLLSGGEGLERQVAVVCHHSGYYTDSFTSQTDLDYEWFYNGDTFAPAFMYNRTSCSTNTNGNTPVIFPKDIDAVRSSIHNIIDKESALIVSSEAVFNEDGSQVTMTVNGKRLAPFGTSAPRITVFLTEDNVLADAQAGSGTDSYYHQHIMRSINNTWGDVLTWKEDEFTYSYTFDVASNWKKEDLKLIAAIGSYDASNPNNCAIENVTMSTPTVLNGISSTKENEGMDHPVAYYSIDGRQRPSPKQGLNLVKYNNGKILKLLIL